MSDSTVQTVRRALSNQGRGAVHRDVQPRGKFMSIVRAPPKTGPARNREQALRGGRRRRVGSGTAERGGQQSRNIARPERDAHMLASTVRDGFGEFEMLGGNQESDGVSL